MAAWIREGVRIPLIDGQRVEDVVEPFDLRTGWEARASEEELAAVREEVLRGLATGAIMEVPMAQAKYVSPVFVVPKPGGKWRLIHDLRWLNSQRRKPPRFKHERLGLLADVVRPGDQMVTMDMLDGYRMLEIHPDHQQFFQFIFEGRAYQWRALMFGWSWALFY